MSVRPPSPAATRVAFGVIVVFVLAQVAWWMIFQERYISRVTAERLASWERDATTAGELLGAAGADAATAGELAARYPHLRRDGDGFVIDERVRDAFVREQTGYVRMFAFEGPFFGLVILAGLIVIALSLRAERELKRRQQNFLSAITHEFKTPLSTLRLLVQTLGMRALPADKQRDYLRRMEAELDRLEQTSEQVLASARLEHAERAPALAEFELNSVVQGVVWRVRAGLEARGARLEFRASPEPLPVSVDPDALSVVLSNLLDNAVKYSPGATKPVRVTLERSGDLTLIHVDDEGIGVGDRERGRIFERFYRSGDEMTRRSKGVGLGLHLVRSITEAMNGWVRVTPNPEAKRGSRFTVVLPRRVGLTPDEREVLGPPPAGRPS